MIQLISIAHADVIADAPSLAGAGTKALVFLLSIFSVVAIIGVVVSGIAYFISAGDERKMETAKRAFKACITGVVMGLGALAIVKLLGSFFG